MDYNTFLLKDLIKGNFLLTLIKFIELMCEGKMIFYALIIMSLMGR